MSDTKTDKKDAPEGIDPETVEYTSASEAIMSVILDDFDENDDDAEEDDEVAHDDVVTPVDLGDSTPDSPGWLQETYKTLTEDQQKLVLYLVAESLSAIEETEDAGTEHSDNPDITHQEGNTMGNIWEQQGAVKKDDALTLTHEQEAVIFADAARMGSFKEAVLAHADEYGIQNIDILFPDAKAIDVTPEFIGRDVAWVAPFLAAVRHNPFTRIKSLSADITHDEARAKGYVKGNLKKEEFFGLSKRVTGPTTVYKKQKLDRDDILDITSFDVVSWLKAEMNVMIREEIARAILLGDGREIDDEDKIKDPAGASSGNGIRSVLNDHEFYVHRVAVPTGYTAQELEEIVLRSRKNYKGTNPNFYTTEDIITTLLLQRDNDGRRVYKTVEEVAATLRVRELVPVEPMEQHNGLVGILLNPGDYATGTDKGGDLSWFDDFDIDYNQYKYLIETRMSGALTRHKRAVVFTVGTGTLVTPARPTFVSETGVLTLPAATGYKWFVTDSNSGELLEDGVTGATTLTLDPGQSVEVEAREGNFKPSARTDWTFVRPQGA